MQRFKAQHIIQQNEKPWVEHNQVSRKEKNTAI
jgi:hypothetical protein